MNARRALCAIIALISCAMAGSARAEVINLGSFRNHAPGNIIYSGDYGSYVSSGLAGENLDRTLITIDLSSLLQSLGYNALISVMVQDSGGNTYGQSSPGADIDLFEVRNLGDITPEFSYEGPNPVHQGETAEELGRRVRTLDAASGHQDFSHRTFVSLGNSGKLTADFGSPVAIGDSVLQLSEAGNGETFRVYVDAVVVPAPGVAGLLGMALLRGRRRRRDA